MKIVLADKTELDVIVVNGNKRNVQGSNRENLDIVLPETYTLDAVDKLFTEQNCETLKLIDGNKEYIYNGYTIRSGLFKDVVLVKESDLETEAVYENRITVSIAQRTYTETQLANLVKSQRDQDEVIAELMFGEE